MHSALKVLVVAACQLFCPGAIGQVLIDTAGIAAKISGLRTTEDHRRFWEEIWYADQDLRLRDDIETLDEYNLVAVCYYLNRYGYPDPAFAGKASSIMRKVWIHNRSTAVDKHTFPLILGAFRHGIINEHDLRNYYLRDIYQRHFDDRGYLEQPLAEIFDTLDLNVSGHIRVDSLVALLNVHHRMKTLSRNVIGTWKHPDIIRSYPLNGDTITSCISGKVIEIYLTETGGYYYDEPRSDHSFDPQKLSCDEDADRFTFEKFYNARALSIQADGSLQETDLSGNILGCYTPVQFSEKQPD